MRVHDSQAYRKMGVTRERISHVVELREILWSIQTGFSLVNAAVVFRDLNEWPLAESVETERNLDCCRLLVSYTSEYLDQVRCFLSDTPLKKSQTFKGV